MTALGSFLVVTGLVSEAVVLEWERDYADQLAEEIKNGRPLF